MFIECKHAVKDDENKGGKSLCKKGRLSLRSCERVPNQMSGVLVGFGDRGATRERNQSMRPIRES